MAHDKFDSDEEKESPTTVDKKESKKEDKAQDEGEGEDKAQDEGEGEGEGEESTKRKRKRKRKKKSSEASGSSESTNNANSTDGGLDKLNSLEHTVYVEGIPFVCKEEEVKNFFVSNGCEDVLQMRLPTWQDSGRLRGYGHVVFNTTESRNKALKELNGKNLQKRYLNIQEPKSRDGGGGGSVPARTQPEGCRTVFVKNMPYRGITEEDVEHVFRPCGKIVEGGVRLTRNYTTKELKGFGYIEFKNPEGAFAAVQRAAKGGILLKGRNCYVDYEEGAMKGSFRNADGKLWQKKHGSVHEDRDSKKRMKPSF